MAFPDNLESLQKIIIQKYFFFDEISPPTFWGTGLDGNLPSIPQLRAKEGKYLWSDSHPRKPDFGSPEFEVFKLARIHTGLMYHVPGHSPGPKTMPNIVLGTWKCPGTPYASHV